MIGGFIIAGDTPKRLLIRAVGPSLSRAGVAGALLHPRIHLHDGSGRLIAVPQASKSELAAFDVPAGDSREPSMIAKLEPGNYTVVLSSAERSESGVALLEVYDLEPASSRIAAISTRGMVETGDSVLIGGFIVGGDSPSSVVVRAIGPSLEKNGIQGALTDPALKLYDGNGSLIFGNDDWRSDQEQQLIRTSVAPADDRESAIVAKLRPGNYTAVVHGRHHSTGIALVEVYSIGK